MNTYKGYYNHRQITVQAESLYAAKLEAIEIFKPRKNQSHMVSVVLVEKAGEEVSLFNSNADLG